MPHPTKRCDTCEFWDRQDQWSRREDIGNCHRNAPRPTVGEFEYEILKHITTIAWAHSDAEQKEEDFKNWEQAYCTECSWPATTAEDWCGDWQKREHESKERET